MRIVRNPFFFFFQKSKLLRVRLLSLLFKQDQPAMHVKKEILNTPKNCHWTLKSYKCIHEVLHTQLFQTLILYCSSGFC